MKTIYSEAVAHLMLSKNYYNLKILRLKWNVIQENSRKDEECCKEFLQSLKSSVEAHPAMD